MSSYLVLVKIQFLDGFHLLPPHVEQSGGYPVPPPTTLVGALAYSYAKINGLPEDLEGKSSAAKLLDDVVWATFWAPPYVTYLNFVRGFTLYRQRRLKDLNDKDLVDCITIFHGGPPVDCGVADDAESYIKYKLGIKKKPPKDKVLDKVLKRLKKYIEILDSWISSGGNNALKLLNCLKAICALNMAYGVISIPSVHYAFNEPAYIVYIVKNRELARYAYGIVRLGKKESLIAVEDVVLREITKDDVKQGRTRTRFYFPKEITIDYSNAEVYALPELNPVNFGSTRNPALKEFCVPTSTGYTTADLNDSGIIVVINYQGTQLEVPVPREVIENA